MNSIVEKIHTRIKHIKNTAADTMNMKYYIHGYESTMVKLINHTGSIGPMIKTMITDSTNSLLYIKKDDSAYYYYTRGVFNACMYIIKIIREENGDY